MSLLEYEATTVAGSWEPCFVDPWRGVAHFDGITIESDPIGSARRDRVIPCIADEQVYFCRMLKQLIKEPKGRKALDFGTGSGVLGIAGAAMGLHVTGIDSCSRAIRFAKYNIQNNIKVIMRDGGKFDELIEGDGLLSTRLAGGSFDYIFLNPPFAPTPEGVEAPSSVSAGEDGQHFLSPDFFKRAHHLLKPGGSLLVIHLLLVDAGGRPTRLLENLATQSWSRLEIFMAGDRYPLQEFRQKVWAYPDRSQDTSQLCIAILQLTKPSAMDFEPTVLGAPKHEFGHALVVPQTTWEERLKLHKVALNGSPVRVSERPQLASRALLPAGEFYLRRLSPFLRAVDSHDASEHQVEQALLNWISANGVLTEPAQTVPCPGASGAMFDVIMIESAPWYLSGTANLSLRASASVICHLSMNASQPGRTKAQCADALTEIQQQMVVINREKRSVFGHPEQKNSQAGHWHAAISWHAELSINPSSVAAADKAAVTGKIAWIQLNGIGATILSEPLRQFEVPKDNTSTKSFDECLRAALTEYTDILVKNRLIDRGNIHVYTVALPIPPTCGDIQAGREATGPFKLAGFQYVHGWSRDPWSPTAEDTLADIARIAALMNEEAYARAAERKLQDKWQADTLSFARHELSYVVEAIRRPGLTEGEARLLHSFFIGHLGIEPDDPDNAFDRFRTQLASDPTEALTEVWCDCYSVRQLAHKVAKSTPVDAALLQRWRVEAKEMIRPVAVEATSGFGWTECFPDTKRLRPFYSAVMTALSNSAKHLGAAKNDHNVIQKWISFDVQIHSNRPRILIDCNYSYRDISFSEKVRDLGLSRRANRETKGAHGETKTEAVLRAHTAEYLDKSASDIESDFLSIDWHLQDDLSPREAVIRWQCTLPLPAKK
jgi:hypothetical protein